MTAHRNCDYQAPSAALTYLGGDGREERASVHSVLKEQEVAYTTIPLWKANFQIDSTCLYPL